jgi:hypothetical protein
MQKEHNLIDRNVILLKACNSDFTSDDQMILDQTGLRKSCLDNAPDWLKKWASLICDYI